MEQILKDLDRRGYEYMKLDKDVFETSQWKIKDSAEYSNFDLWAVKTFGDLFTLGLPNKSASFFCNGMYQIEFVKHVDGKTETDKTLCFGLCGKNNLVMIKYDNTHEITDVYRVWF